MSVAEFTNTVRNHLIGNIDNALKRRLGSTSKEAKAFRSSFESASKHIAVLTDKSITNLITELIDTAHSDTLPKDVAALSKAILANIKPEGFRNYVATKIATTKSKATISNEEISNIPQNSLKEYFVEYAKSFIPADKRQTIKLKGTDEYTDAVVHGAIEYISNSTQAGHLVGIFSVRTAEALGASVSFNKDTANYRDFNVNIGDGTDKELNEFSKLVTPILKLLVDADFLTSSVVEKTEIGIKASKQIFGDSPKASTELQFRLSNADSGSVLIKAGTELNKLINQLSGRSTNSRVAFTSFVMSLKEVSSLVRTEALLLDPSNNTTTKALIASIIENASFIDNLTSGLIKSKGSPSILDSIETTIAYTIAGKTIPIKKITTAKIKRVTQNKKVLASNLAVKKAVVATKKLVDEINNNKSKKPKPILVHNSFISANSNATSPHASLDALLRTRLAAQIKSNMGTGNAKNVLNYRTGRFAESATIERTVTSRAGMVSVFYNYMRNPYGTFSEGGKQQYPKTRDPKLLISKSIREIGAQLVGNRMRAILV